MRQRKTAYSIFLQFLTEYVLYTYPMNTSFLLSANFIGVFCLAFLFLLCFCLVHIARLAAVGWKHTAKKPPTPEPQKVEKKAPTPKQEPIYYIVERKKRRAKSSYSEPKEIHFK